MKPGSDHADQRHAERPTGRPRRPWVVGVSGASGTPYAAAVLRGLLDAGESVDLIVSRASRLTLLDETGISYRDAHWREDLRAWLARGADGEPDTFAPDVSDVRHWAAGDLAAGPSSGSYLVKGMLIVPASTACVAGVALGLSKDLLQRAASVTLKERRTLVVAVRETPLGGGTLKHLVALDEAGAVVLPASPGFYAGATHIQDLVDFVAGRVLDTAGVPHRLYRRWEGQLGPARPVSAGPGTPGTAPRRVAEMPTGTHPEGTSAPCDAPHQTPRADPARPPGQDPGPARPVSPRQDPDGSGTGPDPDPEAR